MRLTHEPISSDIIDMELIELKFIFDRREFKRTIDIFEFQDIVTVHHDNRDFEILSDYQPRSSQTFNEQTLLFKKEGVRRWPVHQLMSLDLPSVRLAFYIPQAVYQSLSARQ